MGSGRRRCLAMMLHSVASLGKLYSEQIETIVAGRSGTAVDGANHLQTIVYSGGDADRAADIAFTMYRWDINVRIRKCFFGGGGIGCC